jgi:serine/threonine protein kinase
MKNVFSALAYLHDDVGLIHRDLKPENIVIDSESNLGSMKLIDFGLAVKADKLSI